MSPAAGWYWRSLGAAMASEWQNNWDHSLLTTGMCWPPKWVTSIPALLQLPCTECLPRFQCTWSEFIDWHFLQSMTTAWTAALEAPVITSFAKYSVRFTPGCPLDWWMARIHADYWHSAATAQAYSTGSESFWISSSYRCGTQVSRSARLSWHLTSATFIFSSYSEVSCLSAPSRRLTSISVAA